jgi:hypothetical protein
MASNEYEPSAIANVVSMPSYSQINTYARIKIIDEISGEDSFPPNATLIQYISCEQGQNYIPIPENQTDLLLALNSPLIKSSVMVQYTADLYYSRSLYPSQSNQYLLNYYLVDAYMYAINKIDIVMEDPAYYSSLLQIYKVIGGTTVIYTEGRFDISRVITEYLMEDTDYLVRVQKDGAIKDYGTITIVEPSVKYIYPDTLNLIPGQVLISDNLIFRSYFLNSSQALTSLVITYDDLTNQSANVTIKVFNSTGLYATTTYSSTSRFSWEVANTPTSESYYIEYSVNHPQFGNSPVKKSVVVGAIVDFFDMGLNPGWYLLIGSAVILATGLIVLAPGYSIAGCVAFGAMIVVMVMIGWVPLSATQATILLFIVVMGAGLSYKNRGEL